MPEFLRDGTGTGNLVKKDEQGRLHTDSVARTELQLSANFGRTWNIGTGNLTLTSANASAVMYLKNTGVKNLHIDLYVILAKASTGGSGDLIIEILRNPTGGTILDSPTSITPTNMNFGSAAVPVADIYSGAEGDTLTGEDDILRSKTTADNRLLLGIFTVIPQGSSVGIRLTPPPSNTSMDVETVMEVFEEIVED
mgnify:CR=1 FL=1